MWKKIYYNIYNHSFSIVFLECEVIPKIKGRVTALVEQIQIFIEMLQETTNILHNNFRSIVIISIYPNLINSISILHHKLIVLTVMDISNLSLWLQVSNSLSFSIRDKKLLSQTSR